jgi:hypothetical protein
MGYKEKNLFGGLMSGIGQGMVAQDVKRRKQAVADRDAMLADLREGRAVSKEGREVWTHTLKDFTTKGQGKEDIINYEGAAKWFSDNGHDDLAERARSKISTEVDRDSDKFLEAGIQAKKNAKKINPFGPDALRKDAVKEAYGEGGEDAWIEEETLRIFHGKPKTVGLMNSVPDTAVATTAAAPSKPISSSQYKSVADVGAAYMAGKLTKAEADKILIEQFGAT